MGSLSSGAAEGLEEFRRIKLASRVLDGERDIEEATRNLNSSLRDAANLKTSLSSLRQNLKSVTAERDKGVAEVSGGMIVIKQVMKLLESMPYADQQKFRDALSAGSLARMRQLDDENRGKDSFLDLEKNFKSLSTEFGLGVM